MSTDGFDQPTQMQEPATSADRPPAVGPVQSMEWRRVVAVLVTVAVVMVLLLVVRASGVLRAEGTLPPLPEITQVAPGIVRGARPKDADLQRLRNDYGVRGIVAVGSASIETQASTQYLGIPLHEVILDAATGSPSADQLATLVRFFALIDPDRGQTGGFVYLYDGSGLGPVVVTTLMLQLLDGAQLPAALAELDPTVRAALTPPQLVALDQVAAAAAGDPARAGPYALLVGVRL